MRAGIALVVVVAASGAVATAAARSSAIPRSGLVPSAVAFSDASRGLLGTGELGCSDPTAHCRLRGTIQRTTDGGRTWRIVRRTPWPVVSVSIDAEGDWAQLGDGETLHSRNGGKTWSPDVPETLQATPCPPPLDIYVHQDVVTAHHEWALCAGEGSAGEMRKAVYRLGAHGWRRVDHGLSTFGYPLGMAMDDSGFGLIWESRGPLYVTRDGGSHWLAEPKVAVPEVDFGLSGAALPHGTGFVLLLRSERNQRLIETTDAGRTWRVLHRWR
jgi:photosystem II stability/assembly factor-like uncharacterized protein